MSTPASRWLDRPATRGEVLGWVLTASTALMLWGTAETIARTVGKLPAELGRHAVDMPPWMTFFESLGPVGVRLAFGGIALACVLAQVLRGPTWARVAVPLVCALLGVRAGAVYGDATSDYVLLAKHRMDSTYRQALDAGAAPAASGAADDALETAPTDDDPR